MNQLRIILARLKKPSVVMSVVSQIIAILILAGFQANESMVMTVVTMICNILVTLGIMSNPDTNTRSYGDDLLVCTGCGVIRQHVKVNGRMLCSDCGAVYQVPPELCCYRAGTRVRIGR